MKTSIQENAVFELLKIEGFYFDKPTFEALRDRALKTERYQDKSALQGYLLACKEVIIGLYQASREL